MKLAWNGGVNLNAKAFAIQDGQLAYAKNVWPALEGSLDKREPMTGVESYRHGLGLNVRPINMFKPDPIMGVDWLIHWQSQVGAQEVLSVLRLGSALDYTDAASSITITPEALTEAGLPRQALRPSVFLNYRGRTLVIAGGYSGFYTLYYNETTGKATWVRSSFSWTADADDGRPTAQHQTIEPMPRAMCSYRGRMVYANFGAGMGNWLVFADRNSDTHTNTTQAPQWALVGDDVLDANGRHLELRDVQGENIIGMQEVSLVSVGSAIQTALLVLTERKAIICTGEPAQTTDSEFTSVEGYISDFVANRVNYEVGIAGPNAWTLTPYGLCWASRDEVWMMQGTLPVKVGTNIGPALRECPAATRQFWHMACANNVAYLALVTNIDTSAYADMRINHWRLDLRQGAPENAIAARWWGPQDYADVAGYAASVDGPTMSPALVTHRTADDRDVLYGALFVDTPQFSQMGSRMFIVTYNQAVGGVDTPFTPVLSGRTWSAQDNTDGMIAPLGDYVMPTPLRRNGRLYVVSTQGVPGAAEPTWPTTNGGTVVNGAATYAELLTDLVWTKLVTESPNIYPTILMDIKFKDMDFGAPQQNKLIRRADIAAFFAQLTRVAMPVSANGGNWSMVLGPTTFGQADTRLYGAGAPTSAFNDLMVADESAVAEEYQNRSLRPAKVTRWESIEDGDPTNPGVVRGVKLQPRLVDGDGYVIDDTNNRLVFGVVSAAGLPTLVSGPHQASIPNGYYPDVITLMTVIADAMNDAMGGFLGFTVGADPWTTANAYTGEFPYFLNLKLDFSSRNAGSRIALLFRHNTSYGSDAAAIHLGRSMQLLTMLGFDTSEQYSNALGGPVTLNVYNDVLYVAEQDDPVLTTPAAIYGVQMVPVRRGAVASIASVDMDFHVKAGLPLADSSR